MPFSAAARQTQAETKYNVVTDYPDFRLHSAASKGNLALVEYALTHGQPVNSSLDGVLPIHAACSGGSELVVKRLIDAGADVNAPRLPRKYSDKSKQPTNTVVGSSGSTPLHFAAANGHLHIVQLLLARGADPSKADKHRVKPQDLATQTGHDDIADFLIVWQSEYPQFLAQGPQTSSPTREDFCFPPSDAPPPPLSRIIQVQRSIDNIFSSRKPPPNPFNPSPAPSPVDPLDPSPLFPPSRFPPPLPQRSSPSAWSPGRLVIDNSQSISDMELPPRRPSLPVLQGEKTIFSRGPVSSRGRKLKRPSSAGQGDDKGRNRGHSLNDGYTPSPSRLLTDDPRQRTESTTSSQAPAGTLRKLGSKYSLLSLFKRANDSTTNVTTSLPDQLESRTSFIPAVPTSRDDASISSSPPRDPVALHNWLMSRRGSEPSLLGTKTPGSSSSPRLPLTSDLEEYPPPHSTLPTRPSIVDPSMKHHRRRSSQSNRALRFSNPPSTDIPDTPYSSSPSASASSSGATTTQQHMLRNVSSSRHRPGSAGSSSSRRQNSIGSRPGSSGSSILRPPVSVRVDTYSSRSSQSTMDDDEHAEGRDEMGEPISWERIAEGRASARPTLAGARGSSSSVSTSSVSMRPSLSAGSIPGVNEDYVGLPPMTAAEAHAQFLRAPPPKPFAEHIDASGRLRGGSLSSMSDASAAQLSQSSTSTAETTLTTPSVRGPKRTATGESTTSSQLLTPPSSLSSLSASAKPSSSSSATRQAPPPLVLRHVSSHAEAQSLVREAQEDIFKSADIANTSPGLVRPSLSEQLAAYSQTLELERKFARVASSSSRPIDPLESDDEAVPPRSVPMNSASRSAGPLPPPSSTRKAVPPSSSSKPGVRVLTRAASLDHTRGPAPSSLRTAGRTPIPPVTMTRLVPRANNVMRAMEHKKSFEARMNAQRHLRIEDQEISSDEYDEVEGQFGIMPTEGSYRAMLAATAPRSPRLNEIEIIETLPTPTASPMSSISNLRRPSMPITKDEQMSSPASISSSPTSSPGMGSGYSWTRKAGQPPPPPPISTHRALSRIGKSSTSRVDSPVEEEFEPLTRVFTAPSRMLDSSPVLGKGKAFQKPIPVVNVPPVSPRPLMGHADYAPPVSPTRDGKKRFGLRSIVKNLKGKGSKADP